MNKRSREYFLRKKEFRSWAIDWVRMAEPGRSEYGACRVASNVFPREITITFHATPEFQKKLDDALANFQNSIKDSKPSFPHNEVRGYYDAINGVYSFFDDAMKGRPRKDHHPITYELLDQE